MSPPKEDGPGVGTGATSQTTIASHHTGFSDSNAVIQPMPDLAPEQFDALRSDIEANGVLVPVIKDQHGRILDGNNRSAIAAELGIDYPVTVVEVADDADAWDKAVTLNCSRRHMTREQVRAVVAAEIVRRPEDSDRAIAKRVGCSPSTVGTVRAQVSNLDTPDPVRFATKVTFSRLMRKLTELVELADEVESMAWEFELDGAAMWDGYVYESDEQHDHLTGFADDLDSVFSRVRDALEGR